MDFSGEVPPLETSPLIKFINPPLVVDNLEYQAILKANKNNKYFQYVDEKFKADKTNLTIYDEKQTAFYNIRWERPNEIYKEKFNFFAGPIKSSHIFQYQYDNLHWISCICTLADSRNMLQKVFLQTGLSPEGIYSVFLHKNGQWKNLIVDDQFPVNIENGKPLFTCSAKNEIWLLVLEKAHAKLCKNYGFLETLLPRVIFRELTGMPCTEISLNEVTKSDLKRLLTNSQNKGYTMVLWKIKENVRREDWIMDICYKVIELTNMKIEREERTFLSIKGYDLYPTSNKEKLPMKEQTIEVDGLSVFFEKLIIIHNHPTYHSTSFKFKPNKNSFRVVQMTTTERTNLFLTLNQPDHRKYPNVKRFNLSYMRMLLARICDQSLEYHGGFHGTEKFLTIESSLPAGSYLLLIEICSEMEKPPKLVIDAYGDKPVKFEALEIIQEDFETLERSVIRAYCRKTPRYPGLDERDFEKEGSKEIRRFFGHLHGIMFLYYVNYSNAFELEEVVQEKSKMKLTLSPPFHEKGNRSAEFVLPIGKEIVILYKTKEKEVFDPDLEEHFQLDSKLNKERCDARKMEHLFFEESSLQHIIQFDNLRFSLFKAKHLGRLNESVEEEKKEDLTEEQLRGQPKEYLEIEGQSGDENHQLDQNELMQSLIGDDTNHVLSCEVSATSCFDWLIGNRITHWIEILLITSTISMLIAFIQSILRPNLLDTLIYVSVVAQLVTKTITRTTLTVTLGMLVYSFLLDFIWVLLFNTIFSGEDLVVFSEGVPYRWFKIMAVVLTFLNFLGKIWLFMVLWRFRVKYRKMKRLSDNFHNA